MRQRESKEYPKKRCPVCGCRDYWWRSDYRKEGEAICDECGCFMKPYTKYEGERER